MKTINSFILLFLFATLNLGAIEVLEVKILNSYSLSQQFPGKLLPIEQSKLAFEIPGKIKIINVDVGDEVQEGQILAKLDDREAQARLNQV